MACIIIRDEVDMIPASGYEGESEDDVKEEEVFVGVDTEDVHPWKRRRVRCSCSVVVAWFHICVYAGYQLYES